MAERLRVQVNRLLLVVLFLLGLPLIVAAERIRRGSGQLVALRVLRTGARLTGVRIVTRSQVEPPGDRPVILVPNHSSPLDIAALVLAYPEIRFVAAADLYRIPLLRGAMRALGTVPVDRHRPRQGRQDLLALVASGAPPLLAIFPEGGIPPAGRRRPFKTGAFALAIDTGALVVPVAIRGTAELLPPGAAFGLRPGEVTVALLDPIDTFGLGPHDRRTLRDRAQSAVLVELGCPPLELEGVETA
ncbi:MAG TPA: lysophospholipid acyltransferase family protein [Acidimicrobiales bacterium]|nr:lysophospholipid acyltransferase family protein [Acidimicrobiales bacterium]